MPGVTTPSDAAVLVLLAVLLCISFDDDPFFLHLTYSHFHLINVYIETVAFASRASSIKKFAAIASERKGHLEVNKRSSNEKYRGRTKEGRVTTTPQHPKNASTRDISDGRCSGFIEETILFKLS